MFIIREALGKFTEALQGGAGLRNIIHLYEVWSNMSRNSIYYKYKCDYSMNTLVCE